MALTNDTLTLWTWPLALAKVNMAAFETMTGAPKVVGARLPMIAQALANPWSANVSELIRMVSEKDDAARISGKALSKASAALQKAAEGNARDLGKLSGGTLLWPSDYWRMTSRNVAALAALATLPADMLTPVNTRVAGNVRRLAS